MQHVLGSPWVFEFEYQTEPEKVTKLYEIVGKIYENVASDCLPRTEEKSKDTTIAFPRNF